jgi:prepilin-type N-terminal cleavage/methylation domain-containing protein
MPSLRHCPEQTDAGFTLVELVVAMSLLAVLAAVGGARFFDLQAYRTRVWADQVLGTLNTARAMAIAAHSARLRVTLDSASVTLLQTSDCAQSTGVAVLQVGSTQPLTTSAPSGVTLSMASQSLPYVLCFDAMGRPRDTSSAIGVALGSPTVLNISSSASSEALTLEAETGWIHR